MFRTLLLILALAVHGGRFYVTPQVCFAPCSVQMRVSPPEEGDGLVLEADSGAYYTVDVRPKPSTTRVYEFKNLPEGTYGVRATVFDHQKPIWSEEKTLKVAGPDGNDGDQSKNISLEAPLPSRYRVIY